MKLTKKSHDNPLKGYPNTHGRHPFYCTSRYNLAHEYTQPTWFDEQMPEAVGSERRSELYESEPGKPPINQWMPLDSNIPSKNYVLRCPRTIILSVLPYWATVTAEQYNFRFPRDIIGAEFSHDGYGNYYYLTQWDVFSTEQLDDTPSNVKYAGGSDNNDGYLNEIVGRVHNPYIKTYHAIMKSVKAVRSWMKKSNGNNHGHWNLIVPQWFPCPWPQMCNNGMMLSNYVYTGRDWLLGTLPCASIPQVIWGPAFPDPRVSDLGFNGPKIPWTMCPSPAFGGDVLHIYVGHPVFSYTDNVQGFQEYQAYPFSPEIGFLGPVPWWDFQPNWDSVKSNSPFCSPLWGVRPIWRDYGFSYGYESGIGGVMGYYGFFPEVAGEAYTRAVRKYRNFQTLAYSFGEPWTFEWSVGNLMKDCQLACEAPMFYFGFEFSDWVDLLLGGADCPRDYTAIDRMFDGPPPHLRIMSLQGKTVSSCSIIDAELNWFPPLRNNVEHYYKGIDPGAEGIFHEMATNSLNFASGGPLPSPGDESWLMSIAEDFFMNGVCKLGEP